MITRLVLLAHHSDVVVSAVHCRTHQVYRAGIHTDILFVSVLLMDRSCDKRTVRSQHETSKLSEERNIAHSCRNENFLVNFSYALTDNLDIVRLLVRSVRDSDSAGEVDELDVSAGLFL